MPVKLNDIISLMNIIAPAQLAVEGDNVGLIIGDEDSEISSILIALDIDDNVIDEAIKNKSNLIIIHHPIIFTPFKALNIKNFKERIIHRLILSKINVFAAHSNLDVARTGINELLVKKFDLTSVSILYKTYEDKGKEYGLGRIGYLTNPLNLYDLCFKAKDIFKIESVNVVGLLDRVIKKVAICSGDGTDFITAAYNAGCDAYITGDLRYHDACDARDMGIAVIDAGHFATEYIYMTKLCEELRKEFVKLNFIVNISLSNKNKDPISKV